MREVTGIRLAVTARDLAGTVPSLKAGGFAVWSLPGGGVVAYGGGTTIRFDSVPVERVGLGQVEMSLNQPVPYRHVERIGHSALVVGPRSRAVWTFEEQDPPGTAGQGSQGQRDTARPSLSPRNSFHVRFPACAPSSVRFAPAR